ncbi:hypothetical protein Ddye_018320 [Dipteronia dyeriana]|uniref:RWD domain-containing protein n=1 Tax=Dipteronia dyeriana TaxID=168575 RepID=A0AAD9UAB2_9ROSI|nr:hypothetical protein Ddye_018320 [Dipteronia dyeriana]
MHIRGNLPKQKSLKYFLSLRSLVSLLSAYTHTEEKKMAEEEEVTMELEAVQAVYEDDCVVLESYPPHIHLHIKPRTADDSSQQFVEAVIGIRAGPKYPKEPPHVNLIESKGLDEQRRKLLISSIQDKACELSSCLMLVALCEESVEKLSNMNHPDGDCPLCLYSMFPKDKHDEILPFMKLMSCFHCFHSECIVRWWNWLQSEKETNADNSTTTVHPIREIRKDMNGATEEDMGSCPVCRKVFQAKDIEHVLDLVGNHSSQLGSDVTEVDDGEKLLLQSDSELVRREKFEAIIKLQQEISGLIEPKRELLVLPGMFLPQPATLPTATSIKENTEQEQIVVPIAAYMNPSGSSNRPSTSSRQNSGAGMRKPRVRNNPRKPVKHWIRKDSTTAE